MIFKSIVIVSVLMLFQPAFAGCLSTMSEGTGKSFESYSFCKNTVSAPQYQLSWYSSTGTTSEDFVMLFNFDPRGSSVTCKDFSVNGKDVSSCQAFAKDLNGNIRIPDKYEGRHSTVYMYNIEKKDNFEDLSKIVKEQTLSYKSSKSIDEVKDMECFAGIDLGENKIFLGYSLLNFQNLAYCLENMERWISADVKRTKRLIN